MRVRVSLLMMIAFATLSGTASSGAGPVAFDMTGHWVGKFTCKGVDETGKFKDDDNPSTLDITQTGSLIAVSLDSGDFSYNGSLIPDIKKPDVQGEVVLIGCNTNTTFVAGDHSSEIMRAKVKTKANSVKASFSGISLFEINDAQFGESIETCKLSYKRVDAMPPVPAITGCAP
ncbi:MAG TPA: hypothetical protein VGK30_17840 [Candidatus Binatia bacterium]|jgi:hypothetical protein